MRKSIFIFAALLALGLAGCGQKSDTPATQDQALAETNATAPAQQPATEQAAPAQTQAAQPAAPAQTDKEVEQD